MECEADCPRREKRRGQSAFCFSALHISQSSRRRPRTML